MAQPLNTANFYSACRVSSVTLNSDFSLAHPLARIGQLLATVVYSYSVHAEPIHLFYDVSRKPSRAF